MFFYFSLFREADWDARRIVIADSSTALHLEMLELMLGVFTTPTRGK